MAQTTAEQRLPDEHDRVERVTRRNHIDRREGRPYLACPHCGTYEYRWCYIPKYRSTSWIPFVGEVVERSDEYYECTNCKYRQEVTHD